MKKFKTLASFLFIVLAAICLQSCGNEKFTVWTESESYSDFYSTSGVSIDDGCYIRVEISKEQWENANFNFENADRHRWDEETIKKWLIANGFGNSEATKEASWFSLVNHGMIVSRTQNAVYGIIK